MKVRKVLITRDDLLRLEQLIDCALRFQPLSHQHLIDLQQDLEQARIIVNEDAPTDRVTMNSEVLVKDVSDGSEFRYRLVYPRDAHLDKNRISVLAPLGAALLGRKEGELFKCKAPEESNSSGSKQSSALRKHRYLHPSLLKAKQLIDRHNEQAAETLH